jgi:TRAP-type C4-dicarboxylate transport system permease small subunit
LNGSAGGLALVGAAGIALMLLHVTAHVVLRLVAATPIPATVEIVSTYYMVLIAFLPLAWAERRGDMIVVEVFDNLYPKRLRRFVDALVGLVCAAAYGALAYTTWLVALREFEARSFTIALNIALPTWPGYFVLPVSFALAATVCLYRAADALTRAPAPGEIPSGTRP